MSKKKSKGRVLETRIKKEPNFIRFTKLQKNYLSEVRTRQLNELNEALGIVYEELGIAEKIAGAPPGKYKLRQDLSGLDVLPPIKLKIEKHEGSEKEGKPQKELIPPVSSKGKPSKDN